MEKACYPITIIVTVQDNININVKSSMKVLEIQGIIAAINSIKKENVSLTHKGRPLDPFHTLEDYDIALNLKFSLVENHYFLEKAQFFD